VSNLTAGHRYSFVVTAYNSAGLESAPSNQVAFGPVAKDFTGNGWADLLWQNTTTGDLSVWLMKNGAYNGSIAIPGAPPPWRCAGAGDFNGDGQADLVWENAVSGDRWIWILNQGVFSYPIYIGRVSVEWRIAGVGDFDGDGQADLLWEDTVTGDHVIWFMKNG